MKENIEMKDLEKMEIYGIKLPIMEKPFNLAEKIVEKAEETGVGLRNGDIIVVTSKIVLKSKGLLIDLERVKPGIRAKIISKLTGKDPVETQIILDNSKKIYAIIPLKFLEKYVKLISRDSKAGLKAVESVKALMFVQMKNGIIASDAGLDYSNIPPEYVITGNHNFDSLAKEIREKIKSICGREVAVIIADTEVSLSNGKIGSLDFAVGSSGIETLTREFGEEDFYGRPKFGGLDIIVDEACAAAALLMKQGREGIPIVIIRGLKYEKNENGIREILITRRGGEAKKQLLKTLLLNLLLKMLRII